MLGRVSVIGWDIGGVNTKVARVDAGRVLEVHSRPFEIQRRPQNLTAILTELSRDVRAAADDRHAVTMTAELSQAFRTKREGVAFVLDAVDAAFPGDPIHVFTTDGTFLDTEEARRQPLAVAASNWMATAMVTAWTHPDALLLDTGTTTTDITPIVGGRVMATGRTDPERLMHNELAYRGVLRTPADAVGQLLPYRDGLARVSMEGFALIGDAFLWLGDLAPEDYTVPAPDGRPATREFAGERLARLVCADREMIDEAGVTAIAQALATALVSDISICLYSVRARHPQLTMAVVTGLGAFIAERAAREHELDVQYLAQDLGEAGARSAPATAVALLLDEDQ